MKRFARWWKAFVRWTRLLSVQMTVAMYSMMLLVAVLPVATVITTVWIFYMRGQENIVFVPSDNEQSFLRNYVTILDEYKPVEGRSREQRFLAALEADITRFSTDKEALYEAVRQHEQLREISSHFIEDYSLVLSRIALEARAEAFLEYLKAEYARFQDEATLREVIQKYDSDNRNGFIIFCLFFVIAILLLLFGIWLARRITKRTVRSIKAVVDASEKVAAGDFDARVPFIKPRHSSEEARLLAQNFNTMTSALAKLERERRSTLAAIAHELRTPLTILQGKLDLLQEGIDPLDLQHIAKLSRHTELLARLVDDLRTLSLAEAQRLSLNVMPVELVALCQEITDNFADNDKNIRILFETTLAEQWLELDPDRIAQVVSNLLDNAIRYSPEATTVTLQLEHKEATTYLRVRDEGRGIDSQEMQRIFARFYRAEQSRERSTGGTGLGLAVVKALVELHGGSVWAENFFEGGAVFTVAFTSR